MKLIQQDMLRLERGILFHQVNCQGVMGGGIAYALARKFPGLEEAYRGFIETTIEAADKEFVDGHRTEDGDILCESDLRNDLLLGKVFVYEAAEKLYIANVFGQGDVSSRYRMTSYDATARALEEAQCFFDEASFKHNPNFDGLPLYFPYTMGCGLGGGNWTIYSSIIEAYFPDAIICKHI